MSLMKDAWGRDRPGGAADRALIPGSPNGGTRQVLPVTAFGREVRREVKHLSTCRKGYSVSSGERKRRRLNRRRAIPCRGCGAGVVGTVFGALQGPGAVTKQRSSGTGLDAWP